MPPWLATDPTTQSTDRSSQSSETSSQSTETSSQFVVVVDPGMAFGTGEHATTRACLRLLQRAQPLGKTLADVGTGSGVLAIAAAKLGASRVVGVEIDHDAISNAESNIALNGVSDRVTIIEGDADPLLKLLAPFEIIVANILSSVIRELFDCFAYSLSPSGTAILSGILDEESAAMRDFLAQRGWIIESEDIEERWWSVLIARQ